MTDVGVKHSSRKNHTGGSNPQKNTARGDSKVRASFSMTLSKAQVRHTGNPVALTESRVARSDDCECTRYEHSEREPRLVHAVKVLDAMQHEVACEERDAIVGWDPAA